MRTNLPPGYIRPRPDRPAVHQSTLARISADRDRFLRFIGKVHLLVAEGPDSANGRQLLAKAAARGQTVGLLATLNEARALEAAISDFRKTRSWPAEEPAPIFFQT